jgi:hypothetical protein
LTRNPLLCQEIPRQARYDKVIFYQKILTRTKE